MRNAQRAQYARCQARIARHNGTSCEAAGRIWSIRMARHELSSEMITGNGETTNAVSATAATTSPSGTFVQSVWPCVTAGWPSLPSCHQKSRSGSQAEGLSDGDESGGWTNQDCRGSGPRARYPAVDFYAAAALQQQPSVHVCRGVTRKLVAIEV